MSNAVMRGSPTASQLYLDTILHEIQEERKCRGTSERDEVNLAEIIYFCMKKQPDDIYMINGSTGRNITNQYILEYSVPLTQAIRVHHVKGRIIMFVMRSHEQMAALYYATLFADVVPFMIDPDSTVSELKYFLQLVKPCMVFCDIDRYDDVMVTANSFENFDVKVIGADCDEHLRYFCGSYWKSFNNFLVSEASTESTAILIPTSGSSGLPKATILVHEGLIAQLPTLWCNHDTFPRPTKRALLLSSAQWVTHTLLMTTCPVFGVTLIMTPQKPTIEHVLYLLEKFEPTWSLFNPIFLKSVVALGSSEQFRSLKTVIVTGCPLTYNSVKVIREKLPESTHFGNGMGMTEAHSFITMPAPGTDWLSNGKIVNIFQFKILDEDSNNVDVNQKGELYLMSKFAIFRGYYENEEAYRKTVTLDGWYKTGDLVYKNESNDIYFVERKQFWFKYLSYHISPEELEKVISSVPEVKDCVVVCDCDLGPTAAIVLISNNNKDVKYAINRVVNETLSEYKQLRGGIYIVPSIPRTHSGKIKRKECFDLVLNLARPLKIPQ